MSGLVEVDLDEAIALTTTPSTDTASADIASADITVPARYLTRDPNGRQHRIPEGILSRADLVPNYLSADLDQLYLRMFTAAHHYLAGACTHLFR
ncbi:hypothetical protein [Actinomadura sp. NEAU-AAG7]|uniref:hypothetical protein n=1 Tax=Actinomadura sp. NEAU-AAG7 TaxID=2839640 RepID=UPI0020331187|nr:hypothetical protein [Actinomadura sp. NEAU-AAG7]